MMDSIKKSDDTKQEAILSNNEISTSNKEEDKQDIFNYNIKFLLKPDVFIKKY